MKKHIASLLTRSLLLTLALVGLVQAEDTPQLQQIKHTILSPSSEQIVLKLSGSYSPKTFTLKDQSPRVVFDFDDMTQGKGVHNLVTTEGSLIKAIRVGVHRDQSPKTRVVVDLNSFKGVNYTQQFDEKTSTLTIRFTGPEKKEGKETAKESAAENGKSAKSKVETAKAKQTSEVTLPPNMAEEKSTQAKGSEEPAAVTPPPAPVATAAPPAPVAVEPPPPAKETVAQATKEVPPPATKEQKSGKKDEGKKAEEKTLAPVKEQPIAAEAKPTQAVPVEKVVPPAPPAVPAAPAVPPPVATTPQAQAAAPVPPAVKESAPVAPKESPSTAAKELKGKKEEVKKAEEKTPPAKEQPATTEAKPSPAEKTPPEAKQPAEQTPPVLAAAANAEPELESIKFDPSSPKGEMIMFKLNGFHPPAVHGVEEGIPRVICDFNNTKLGSAAKKQIKTNGQHVKVIRTSVTKKPEKVRVVIDLEPNRSYDLQQVFFKDDNLFVIIVNTIGK